MKKINPGFLFPSIALVLLVYTLSGRMFGAPPLGKLLNPFVGAEQGNEKMNSDLTIRLSTKDGLNGPVRIVFDSRKVPHIYAKNAADLYFAQGYVAAYLRLWQMDFLTYVAGGRLCEIFGEDFLGYDRHQRRLGIPDAARASLQVIEKDPETDQALAAYSKGVNAYIGQLAYKDLPLEYKLLDYKPEPWSKLKTTLIMKYMANMLSGYEEDQTVSNMMLALGEDRFNKLYPEWPSHFTAVAPGPKTALPGAFAHIARPAYLNYGFMSSGPVAPENSYNPKLGSNSWAVSGEKTLSGSPILCNDPHLGLSLPSIWMEMQLSAPGMNVYGVSIPGTPAVIIGFNENIAWGTTNGADDIKDWYKLTMTSDYKKYRVDGKWLDMHYTVEEIGRRGHRAFYDTIYHTMYGPVTIDKSFLGPHPELLNYALKWGLHHPSNEFLTFIKLSRARNYADYKEAIKTYTCPIQNFTFACKDNTIAITHQGRMTLKEPGEGMFILDGSSSLRSERIIPEDSLPQLLNPGCHYVLSANNHPTDASYPYYYNGYFSESRANRIREMLEKEDKLDIEKMEAIQLDNTNGLAVDALPVLFGKMDLAGLSVEQRNDLDSLRNWAGKYERNDKYARLFELWWSGIREYTWDELDNFSFHAKIPADYTLLDLIRDDPENILFDRQGTTVREKANDIILTAFMGAANAYEKAKKEGSIQWGDYNKVNIMHLTNIKAFSRTGIPSAGYSEAINAVSSTWGPSWRMVVELGDRPRAFGIFAGGQSGNTGSMYYDNFINDWNKGTYYPLNFFMSESEAGKQASNTWIIQ